MVLSILGSQFWLVNGIANVELFNFLQTLKLRLSLKYDAIDTFFKCWHWYALCRNSQKDACSPARVAASSEKLKAGASEILDMYPVVRCFFDELRLKNIDDIQAEVLSVYAIFSVLYILATYPETE